MHGRTRPGVDYRLVDFAEAPDSTVAVIEYSDGERVLLIDGFQATAETHTADYMTWMGRLPMLLHDRPTRGLVICFGTGQTANAMRREAVPALDVVELSPAVLSMAPLFQTNEDVLDDPTVRSIVMDGRAFLRRTDHLYDIVTLEPMPPNFAGVNALYSVEFYEHVAGRLAPGGIAVQWLPFHITSPEHSARSPSQRYAPPSRSAPKAWRATPHSRPPSPTTTRRWRTAEADCRSSGTGRI